ncbi:MAG: PilZ domain-containing protein [Desulfobacterium sp.]|nr:PilZ domain-containing protein [Desulfobacterium sp.]MBU3948715.1 PilZ domain-containing protein [Pseudomonadota bacterium]MBU4009732.1 PilZ domain-containing protein [Pseudomonadota bacterium]MBU4036917.1 PilZ domain-containing protein [Pseudomonadota bacterium]
MNDTDTKSDRRKENRLFGDQYHSVQIAKPEFELAYHFRIRNISTKGMCIIVRQDSKIMEHLNVGDIFEMQFYPMKESDPVENAKAEIKHISKDDLGKFRGHYLVGLNKLEPE